MLRIREYEKGDIYQVFLANSEKYQSQLIREDVLMMNIAFTFIDYKDTIVACAGLVMLWEGVYECWVVFDERYKYDYLLSLLKTMKNSLDNLPSKSGVVRVHSHMNEGTQNYDHLMTFLGFEKEAELVDYFPDKKKCILYRRLYECPRP